MKEGSVCVRVGFQGRYKLTWKVILGGMIYELYRHYLPSNLKLNFEIAALTGAAVIN